MTVPNSLVRCMASAVLALTASSVSGEVSFEDVTVEAGVERAGGGGESFGASWGDLDGDGYPDLFVSNHWTRSSLFLNTRTGNFVDVRNHVFAFVNKPNADTHGGTWFDFDNDGTQDLFVTVGVGNPDMFLVNERGALIDRTGELGLNLTTPWASRLPVWMDYDGDGLPDFVMSMTGAAASQDELIGSTETIQLMRQLPGGGFERETEAVGLSCLRQQYAQLIDVSRDGRLDLLCPENGDNPYPQRAYNTLPIPWEDLRSAVARNGVTGGSDSIIADFDNDGRMDIFLLSGTQLRPSGAEINGAGNRLEARLMGDNKGFSFTASGPVTFELGSNVLDEHPELGFDWIYYGAGGANPQYNDDFVFTLDPTDPNVVGMPAASGTPPRLGIGYDPETQRWTVNLRSRDGDGGGESVYTDVYFQVSAGTIGNLVLSGMWEGDGPARPTLLMNLPEGFEDVTEDAGLAEPVQCASVTAGDFDNDMYIDLYLACRTATSNLENILYMNQGDGTFVRVTGAGGATGPMGMAVADGAGTSDTAVTADYDLDGFLDIFVVNGLNFYPKGRGGPNNLYRNIGNDNNWVHIDLVGTDSHREAVGAVVEATADRNGVTMTQTRVKNGSYHRWSHDHTRMHFGLAQAETVDLVINWPSGEREEYQDVAVNRVYRVTEGGGIEAISPDDALPYPCGLPEEFSTLSGADLNAAVGRGLFLGKECTNGTWQLRATRGEGGEVPLYSGRIVSSSPFERIRLRNLQIGDTVLCDGEPCAPDDSGVPGAITAPVTEISYQLRVVGGFRGIDFTPQDGANTCITAEATEDAPIMGLLKRQVSSDQFYIDTLEACPDGVPLPPPDPSDNPGGNDDDDDGDGGDGGDNGGNDDDGNDGDNDNGGNDDDGGNTSGGSGGGGGALGFYGLFAMIPLLALRRRSSPLSGRPAGARLV